MQFTKWVSSLLISGITGVHAAPAEQLATRQRIPFNIALMNDNGCGATRYSSSFPNNSTTCQAITLPAAGAFATTALPAGCTIQVYSNPTCNSANVITVPHDTSCFSFGGSLKITSLRVSGTCPGFQS